VFKTFLFYAGFSLIFILFSEEFARVVKWLTGLLRRHPRLKVVVYPLALLLAGAGLLIIGNSLISLFTTANFSYE
jgi:H+/Cl- antiporter ClcA